MFTFSKKPLSTLHLIGSSIRLYGHSFLKLWYLYAGCLLLSLLGQSRYLIHEGQILQAFTKSTANLLPLHHRPLLIALYILIGAIVYLILFFLHCVAMHRMQKIVTNPNLSWRKSFLEVKTKFLKIFFNQLLVNNIAIILFTPFVLAGVFIETIWIFCIPLILFEGQKITQAMKSSFNLVWGHWWQSFFVVGWLFLIGIFILLNLFIPIMHHPDLFIWKVLSIVYVVLNSFLFLPLCIAAILVQYNNLKLYLMPIKKTSV